MNTIDILLRSLEQSGLETGHIIMMHIYGGTYKVSTEFSAVIAKDRERNLPMGVTSSEVKVIASLGVGDDPEVTPYS